MKPLTEARWTHEEKLALIQEWLLGQRWEDASAEWVDAMVELIKSQDLFWVQWWRKAHTK